MSCSIAAPNVAHCSFSPSNSSINSNNNNNLMVKFEQLDMPISTSNNRTSLMKRRRPAKISIPVSNLSNLINIGTKSSDDGVKEIEVEGDGYGVFCKRGKSRAYLEDRYSAIVNNVSGQFEQAFFGIFDGHGGAKAAEFTAQTLGDKILENVGSNNTKEAISKELMVEKIRGSFLEVDNEFVSSENSCGGACCISAFIQHGTLMVSNVGDCRAVISRGGMAEPLSTDHTPARDDEKLRIQSTGGYVDECNGVWRVQGTLAVSRAVGDKLLKQWVIAEPETKIITIQPDSHFLILASDGLWNKVTNQEAVDLVVPFYTTKANKSKLALACRKLAELSISRGSNDDTSVLVIHLGRFAS
ncbi:putative protein phosphatase 2C 53 [Silene latifolia]|uniref:putative protein phosphatase 2C 53 n=1 Tax=Silene latifolia TaxID=37657 RepID=UPI003D780C41